MAKINKQEIMQKLIDELQLYPGKDLIPSELADKILAVYQINEQAVNFKEEGDIRVLQDLTLNANDKSFTVPAGKKWKLIHGFVKYISDAGVGSRLLTLSISDGTTEIWFIEPSDDTIIASETNRTLISSIEGLTTEKGTNSKYKHYPIPKEMIIPAGSVIRFWDSIDRSATDDMEFTFIVVESDYTDIFT